MKFVDEVPPARDKTGRGRVFEDDAGELRRHRGQWALLYEITDPPGEDLATLRKRKASVMAGNIRAGQLAAFKPRGTFEAKSRGYEVYARYVGET